MQKIYIAGPDVFEKDSIQIGQELIKKCQKYGYEGLYPLDNLVDFSQEKHTIARDIYEANISMIQSCDIVIANLNAFRGKEADSGTVWECGYAYGLGKKVYAYMQDTSPYISTFTDKKAENGIYFDAQNRVIEDFNHPINLMIACSSLKIIEGTFENVLQKLQSI